MAKKTQKGRDEEGRENHRQGGGPRVTGTDEPLLSTCLLFVKLSSLQVYKHRGLFGVWCPLYQAGQVHFYLSAFIFTLGFQDDFEVHSFKDRREFLLVH